MSSSPKRDFKTSIWRPGWIGGAAYFGVIAFVASLKDVFAWFDAAITWMHGHPLSVIGGSVVSILGNILYTDNRYHEQQRELEAIRRRRRPRGGLR